MRDKTIIATSAAQRKMLMNISKAQFKLDIATFAMQTGMRHHQVLNAWSKIRANNNVDIVLKINGVDVMNNEVVFGEEFKPRRLCSKCRVHWVPEGSDSDRCHDCAKASASRSFKIKVDQPEQISIRSAAQQRRREREHSDLINSSKEKTPNPRFPGTQWARMGVRYSDTYFLCAACSDKRVQIKGDLCTDCRRELADKNNMNLVVGQ
jgi:hypothetical protein